MWQLILKKPITIGSTKVRLEPLPEEEGSCNKELKAYVDKVKSKINIDIDNEGINYYASARTTENKYEPIPEPVACAALKFIKEYDFSNTENDQWFYTDNDGKGIAGGFFEQMTNSNWSMHITNYSRGGAGRIGYDIQGKKYSLLEFWIRGEGRRHPHDYAVYIKIMIFPRQSSQRGGIPKSKAIGDFEFMKKYADWRK